MRLQKGEKFNKLIADEGKHIRDAKDVYIKGDADNVEHIPHYSSVIYLPKSIDLENAMELYVEEDV